MFSLGISFVLLLFLISLSSVCASTSSPQMINVFTWALSASSPSQATRLAEISYDPTSLQASVLSYTPPSPGSSKDDLLRIGLFTDKENKQWVGSLTSLSAFSNSSITPNLNLYLSSENDVYNVAVSPSTSAVTDEARKLSVEIVRPSSIPMPHLNRPIVVKETGEEAEEEPEKSLIQKYWWAIPIVLLLALGGGGEGR